MNKYKTIVANYYSIIDVLHSKHQRMKKNENDEEAILLDSLKLKAYENGVIAGLFKKEPIDVILVKSYAEDIDKYGCKNNKFGQNHEERARVAKAVNRLMLKARKEEHEKRSKRFPG